MQEENIMNKLSLGLSEFNNIVKENKIYIDKTKFIKKMLDQGRRYYFLSRPRRFGKTLFISTLKNFFEGNKKLFKNTDIYDYNWNWDEYPVVRISMNNLSNNNPKSLEKDILDLIKKITKENNIKLNKDNSYIRKFSQLIEELAKKSDTKQIVVLIDEYDAPILDHINNTNLANANRKILQNFYNVLKNSEDYLKLVFITGITKFTKTSIFSKFNNFVELSLHEDYTTICGITHEELKHYYHDQIEDMSLKNKLTWMETLDKFDHWYDGYSWDGVNKVFNPFSVLNALYERKFVGFWFGSGTPTFLTEIFKHKEIIGDYTKPRELKYSELDAIDPENINQTAMLFQGGYLTIDKELVRDDIIHFHLKIPNFEVKTAFKDNLNKLYVDEAKQDFNALKKDMWNWIKNGECDKLAKKLKIKFSRLPQNLKLSENNNEKWKLYSSIFLAWLDEMGMRIDGEKIISHGIIDAVLIENDTHVAIIEIKYSETEKALESLINKGIKQIHEKEYYLPYEDSNVSLIALAFKDRPIKNGIITDVKCRIEKWNY